MSELIKRLALAKAQCLRWRWELLSVEGSGDPKLYRVYARGPVGLGIRIDLNSANIDGATLEECESFLDDLQRAVATKIESHACSVCDNGGVCDFHVANDINVYRRRGSYEPSLAILIENILQRDSVAANPSDIVRSTGDSGQCPDLRLVLDWR